MQKVEMAEKVEIRSFGFFSLVSCVYLATFNDNAFRQSVILLAYAQYSKDVAISVASASTAAMLLPYAFFSLLAGQFSDKYAKHNVFRIWKMIEIPLVLIGLFGLLGAREVEVNQIILIMVMLFGLGLQTSFLAPSRMGILPEILEEKNLSAGNGFVETGSSLGILSGTIVAGFIVQGLFFGESFGEYSSVARNLALLIMPVAAVVGAILSFFIPKVRRANPEGPIWSGLAPMTLINNLKKMAESVWLLKCAAGLCIFWAVSTFYMLNIPLYAQNLLGYSAEQTASGTTILLSMVSIGIGLGSAVAGFASRGKINLSLIRIGSYLWIVAGLFLGAIYLAGTSSASSEWMVRALVLLGGFSGGFYLVPLNSYVEARSPAKYRSSFIGTINVLTVLSMIGAAGVHPLLAIHVLDSGMTFWAISLLLIIPLFWAQPKQTTK